MQTAQGEILQLFNEKASRVIDVLLSNPDFSKAGAVVQWDGDRGWDSVHVGADSKTLEAAILSLRFFCQHNEPTSFRNMGKLYASIDPARAVRFDYVRDKLNRLLTLCKPSNEAESVIRGVSDRAELRVLPAACATVERWLSPRARNRRSSTRAARRAP